MLHDKNYKRLFASQPACSLTGWPPRSRHGDIAAEFLARLEFGLVSGRTSS